MTTEIQLGLRHREAVRRAEEEAHRMMDTAGFGWCERSERKWLDAFGATEEELRELLASLATRYAATPIWRRHERKAIREHYISVNAMIGVAFGLETVWG